MKGIKEFVINLGGKLKADILGSILLLLCVFCLLSVFTSLFELDSLNKIFPQILFVLTLVIGFCIAVFLAVFILFIGIIEVALISGVLHRVFGIKKSITEASDALDIICYLSKFSKIDVVNFVTTSLMVMCFLVFPVLPVFSVFGIFLAFLYVDSE